MCYNRLFFRLLRIGNEGSFQKNEKKFIFSVEFQRALTFYPMNTNEKDVSKVRCGIAFRSTLPQKD